MNLPRVLSGDAPSFEVFIYFGDSLDNNPLVNKHMVVERELPLHVEDLRKILSYVSRRYGSIDINVMSLSKDYVDYFTSFIREFVDSINKYNKLIVIVNPTVLRSINLRSLCELLRSVGSAIIYHKSFPELYDVIDNILFMKDIVSRLHILSSHNMNELDLELTLLIARKYNIGHALVVENDSRCNYSLPGRLIEQPLRPTAWLNYKVHLYLDEEHGIRRYILRVIDDNIIVNAWRIPGQGYVCLVFRDPVLLSNYSVILEGNCTSFKECIKAILTSYPSVSEPKTLKLDIVFRINNSIDVDETLIEALKLIEKYGCLKHVASKLGLTYISLKKKIESLEKALESKVVATYKGGIKRGGATLTSTGRLLVDVLDELYQNLRVQLNQHLWLMSSSPESRELLNVKFP